MRGDDGPSQTSKVSAGRVVVVVVRGGGGGGSDDDVTMTLSP